MSLADDLRRERDQHIAAIQNTGPRSAFAPGGFAEQLRRQRDRLAWEIQNTGPRSAFAPGGFADQLYQQNWLLGNAPPRRGF